MKILIFFVLPILRRIIQRKNITSLINKGCIDDEEICFIDVVNEYNNGTVEQNTEILQDYFTEEALNQYEECILSGNDACETFWYIDENYTQWKIENGTISYFDKEPLRWVYVKSPP